MNNFPKESSLGEPKIPLNKYNKYIFIVVAYMTSLYFQKVCNTNGLYNESHNKLYDVGFKYVPKIINTYGEYDNLMNIIGILPVIINYDLMPIVLQYQALCCLIRSITINLTILPKHSLCNRKPQYDVGCYDKLFSGHYCFIVLVSIILYKHKRLNIQFISLYNLINIYLILATRSHYSVDLFFASYVSITIYCLLNKYIEK